MNLFSRVIILFAILLLLLTLMPALIGTGTDGLIEDDEIPDNDDFSFINSVPIAWTRIPIHQLAVMLKMGMSIFVLFVVYLGGRSKARRFNDRTIDAVLSLTRVLYKTALSTRRRAVFHFPFSSLFLSPSNKNLIKVFLPIHNSYLRRY